MPMAWTRIRSVGRAVALAMAVLAAAGGCGGGTGGPSADGPAGGGAPPAAAPIDAATPAAVTPVTPISEAPTPALPTRASSSLALEVRATGPRAWVAHPDGDTVAALSTEDGRVEAEIAVGASPRAIAVATDGRIWASVQDPPRLAVVDPVSLQVVAWHALPAASQPFGVVAGEAGSVWVALAAAGEVRRVDAEGRTVARVAVGPDPRHLALTPDGARLLVSRFVTGSLPGESTAAVRTDAGAGAEVIVVSTDPARVERTVVLGHGDRVDTAESGRGIPNYLGAAAVSPDGRVAWVPSKQDNVARGRLRDGRELDFQSTVRAVSSRIDLQALAEDAERRIDHDNASVAAAAAWHPSARWLFVSLETSRQVAVVDATRGRERFRFETGLAPQALAVSPDGLRLFVQSFMSRTVAAYDLGPLAAGEDATPAPPLWSVRTVALEPLEATVLLGKQLFYDARDRRLSRDAYMSCASCHADGGHDGRVWDFTGFGEGLRNTPSLRGRRGAPGLLHWSANFDEVQDFETQIRRLAGGTGLMRDEDLATGSRAQPLGERKAGVSTDLDALAAYVASLRRFDPSPHRTQAGAPSPLAATGRALFEARGCAGCHGGPDVARDPAGRRHAIGTIRPSSGQRLGGPLDGLAAPTLRDAWATAPYLHDGSAATLADAIRAHRGLDLPDAEVEALARHVLEMEGVSP
jgi:DNA-binding beta-propeller fold protein YncE